MSWFFNKLYELRITREEAIVAAMLGTLLYVSSAMMFFGMNFWLWSFAKGLKRSYTSIFIPSVAWALLFGISLMSLYVFQWYHGIRESFLFWLCRRGVILLFLIGLFDSLTGLCAMYSAVHVPVILQSALISTGPIWTFLLARMLYPESQPPFSYILLLVVLFTFGGVTLALVPQIENRKGGEYFSPPWIVIFLLATASFPLYNVLQGRFFKEFEGFTSPFTCKMIMLSVETTIQLVLTILYFPIDATPFFGKTDSIQESWDMFVASVKCIGTCENNAKYMVLYVMGFWIRHVVFAYLNSYSPTVAAVASQLTQPINTCLLLLIPRWNVYGAPAVWYYTLGCFLCLLTSTVIFIWWHLHNKRREFDVVVSEQMVENIESNEEIDLIK